jgi:hypothetical protein
MSGSKNAEKMRFPIMSDPDGINHSARRLISIRQKSACVIPSNHCNASLEEGSQQANNQIVAVQALSHAFHVLFYGDPLRTRPIRCNLQLLHRGALQRNFAQLINGQALRNVTQQASSSQSMEQAMTVFWSVLVNAGPAFCHINCCLQQLDLLL